MQHFSNSDIQSWSRFYRANFINCLSGYKPVSLIGTVNAQGQPNLAIFSNIVHLGADPALIGFINRPEQATPHTLQNIRHTQHFTINHIQTSFVAAAHQTSARYGAEQNEFVETGLEPLFRSECKAPFVQQSHLQYALELAEILPITLNNTFLVIGRVTDVYMKEGMLQEDGFIALDKGGSIVSAGMDGYATVQPKLRYSYAKPGIAPQELTVEK